MVLRQAPGRIPVANWDVVLSFVLAKPANRG